jgi:hypothetical protein
MGNKDNFTSQWLVACIKKLFETGFDVTSIELINKVTGDIAVKGKFIGNVIKEHD